MKASVVAPVLWLLPSILAAANPAGDLGTGEGPVFSLLPQSFQKNPMVDQTVITEMTDEGRKRPPASAAKPVYYLAEIAGRRNAGEGADESRPPETAEVTSSLQRALAVNGFLPSSPEHAPALLLVVFWGAHSNLDAGSGELDIAGTLDPDHRHLLERAALVGGTKFAEEFREALRKQDEAIVSQQAIAASEARLGESAHFGGILIEHGPVRQFTDRNEKTRALFNALGERYYVVASAYDYAEATRGHRRLLWRSKMTVTAESIAMREALPGLIANAAPFLGADMSEAATMFRHLRRDPKVQLGPLDVQGYQEPAAGKQR